MKLWKELGNVGIDIVNIVIPHVRWLKWPRENVSAAGRRGNAFSIDSQRSLVNCLCAHRLCDCCDSLSLSVRVCACVHVYMCKCVCVILFIATLDLHIRS